MPHFLNQIRDCALGYDDTEEYFPWKNRAYFRGMKGCDFLFVKEKKETVEIMVRFPDKSRREAALQYPFVAVHHSMESKGWLNGTITNQGELDSALELIDLSYKFNKPIRHKDDCLEGEDTQIIGFLDELRVAALSFGKVEEFFPFGSRAFKRQNGQIFLYASDYLDYLYAIVRLPMGVREYALTLPFTEIPKYIGNKGWVGVKVSSREEFDILRDWLDLSYELNVPGR